MSTPSSGRDKRKYDRIRVAESRFLWNLGEGGAYLVTHNPRRLGSLFHFEYKLGSRGPIFKALAKVIRVIHKPNPKTGQPAGMAVQFVNISPQDLKNLRLFLADLKKPEKQNAIPQELLDVPEID